MVALTKAHINMARNEEGRQYSLIFLMQELLDSGIILAYSVLWQTAPRLYPGQPRVLVCIQVQRSLLTVLKRQTGLYLPLSPSLLLSPSLSLLLSFSHPLSLSPTLSSLFSLPIISINSTLKLCLHGVFSHLLIRANSCRILTGSCCRPD